MEIISYVLEGDARAQRLHGHRLGDQAGRGAAHERRHRRHAQRDEPVERRARALPADLDPARAATASRRATSRRFEDDERRDSSASSPRPTAATARVTIHQDVRLYSTLLDGATVTHDVRDPTATAGSRSRAARSTSTARRSKPATARRSRTRSRSRSPGSGEVLLFDLN